ncbi:glucosaminylphosphatidylinositol acyltransferase, partial [Lecanoromycetidae sp. Uapishka_2]
MAQSYKALKEDFVSNLSGGSISEINWVTAVAPNREGVFSFWGYLAIFLAGQALGFDILPRNVLGQTATASGAEQRKRLFQRLAIWTAGWTTWFLFVGSYKYGLGLQVSRRLANYPYVLWVAAFNSGQIMLFCLVETLFFPGVCTAPNKVAEMKECDRATSRVLKSFNRNGLAIFLLANLLTGLVNLTLDTLDMGTIETMGVLVMYVGLLTTVAVALDYLNLSIKL